MVLYVSLWYHIAHNCVWQYVTLRSHLNISFCDGREKLMSHTAIDLKNHFCLQHSESLKHINKPLEHLGLDSFCFTSVDLKTSERYVLTDHPEWTRFAYKSDFYNQELVKKLETKNLLQCFVWSDFLHNKQYREVLKDAHAHGLSHGITLLYYTDDHVNMYYAGTSRSLSSGRELFNIQGPLTDFIPYFHYAAKDLIAESVKHTFTVRPNQPLELSDVDSNTFNAFYDAIDIKQLVINEQGDCLTHQESLCIYLAINGKYAKQIALRLNISIRTVEKHIANARKKLNLKFNESLLGKLFDGVYFNHIMFYGKRYLGNP